MIIRDRQVGTCNPMVQITYQLLIVVNIPYIPCGSKNVLARQPWPSEEETFFRGERCQKNARRGVLSVISLPF
jgi:hypothetical protein